MEKSDFNADIFGSKEMLQPAPVDKIPAKGTRPDIAYQLVKDETFAQTQPRLNMATFVTTYMDKYATQLMNEAIAINYIDETEYPRVAVMCAKCINIMANLWNSPEEMLKANFFHQNSSFSIFSRPQSLRIPAYSTNSGVCACRSRDS